MRWYLLCAVVLVAVSGLVAATASADSSGNPNPGVIPPGAKVAGLTAGDWGAALWQWVFSVPAAADPFSDQTGEWAYLGQPGGPVFLLASAWVVPDQTVVAERWVTVSRGEALYLPLEGVFMHVVDVCMDGDVCPEGLSGDDLEAHMRGCADYCISTFAADLYATVDGEPLSDLFQYRSQSSSRFSCAYAAGCALAGTELLPGLTFPETAGEFPMGVTDEYSLIPAPLSPGEHTVTGGGSWSDINATAGVIYHITVE
jgi:hypothetical protein